MTLTSDPYRDQLARILAAWPWATWPDDSLELHLAEMRRLDITALAQAVQRAVRELDRPPSVKWLVESCRPHEYVTADPDQPVEIHPSVARRIRNIYAAKLRAIDAQVAAAPEKRGVEGHWHGNGTASCSICSRRVSAP